MIILLLSIPVLIRILGVLCLSGYMGWIMWRYCLLRAGASITGLWHINGKRWGLKMLHREMEANLLGDSTVTRWVSVLRFQVEGEKRPYVSIVFADSLESEQYRKLIVALKWQA